MILIIIEFNRNCQKLYNILRNEKYNVDHTCWQFSHHSPTNNSCSNRSFLTLLIKSKPINSFNKYISTSQFQHVSFHIHNHFIDPFSSSSSTSSMMKTTEMESLIPKPTRYLRRRRYQRLDVDGAAAAGDGKKTKVIRLRRRQWRMRVVPRLTWAIRSPLKMWTKVKNTYEKFMLRSMNTETTFGNQKTRDVSKDYSRDAFEARLIFEISKALVASHELNSK